MTTTSKEVLSSLEKEKLSRETILAWYRAQRREKFEGLKDAIKQASWDEREKLKKLIVDNTKRELKQHKNLTEAELNKQANDFADELVSAAVKNENIEAVVQKYEVFGGAVNKEALINYWVANNPDSKIKATEESPKYLAMKEIRDSLIKKEVFILIGIIEKYWNRKEALDAYKNSWVGGTFKTAKLYEFFSKDNSRDKVGFYFGTRKITWEPERSFTTKARPDNWFRDKKKTFSVKGWWVKNEEQKDVNTFEGETDFKKVLEKLKGDKWAGADTFLKGLSKITSNLEGVSNKTGIPTSDAAKLKKFISDCETESRSMENTKVKKEIIDWFKAKPHDKWTALTPNIAGRMVFLYGEGCGNYMYRYSAKQKRIYIIRIDGEKVEDKYYGGYIDLKKDEMQEWNSLDEKNTKRMFDDLGDKMTQDQVSAELVDYRLKDEKPQAIPESQKLIRTKGLAAAVMASQSVEYENLQKNYLDKLTEKLKAELVKRGMNEEKALDIAKLRTDEVKKEIEARIEEDSAIKEALDKNPKAKIEIKINENDEVSIKLTDVKLLQRIKAKLKAAEDAKTSPDAIHKNAMAQLEKKVEKIFGPATPVVMWILDKVFKLKDGVKKIATGGKSLGASILTTLLGVKVGKDMIGAKKLSESDFEKMPPKNKKDLTLDKKIVFGCDVTLKNKKIVIPKGKGIKAGGKIKLKLDNRFEVGFDPNKGTSTSKFDFKNLMAKFKKSENAYKDNEITIMPDTVVPKDTIIPKGARIERV